MHARGRVHAIRVGLHGAHAADCTIQLVSSGKTTSRGCSIQDKLRTRMCKYADVLESVVVLDSGAKTRVDTWVSVEMEEDVQPANRRGRRRPRTTQTVQYMANILRFLQVTGTATATHSGDRQPLPEPVVDMRFVVRLAVCELWVTKEVYPEAGSDLLVADSQWSKDGKTLYPVDLSTFQCKYNTGMYDNKRYFFKPYNVSRRL